MFLPFISRISNKDNNLILDKMKKSLLLILLISASASAQWGFGRSERFNFSVSIDPKGSYDAKGFNGTAELELEEHFIYIKGSTQLNTGIEGGYLDICGAGGLNFTYGTFENIRAYAGGRLGVIKRGGNTYPLAGVEAGVDFNISDNIFLGPRVTYDNRSDFEFWGGEAKGKFNFSVRGGVRW